jgi:hypothetical protein
MTQTPTRRFSILRQLRASLLLALPLILIVNVVIYGAYSMLLERQRSLWLIQVESGLDDALLTIEELRNDMHGDLLLLANSPTFKAVLDGATPQNLDRLAAEWEVFAAIKRRYDQIRWLDNRGMERLRINLTLQGAVRVADDQLQDKSGRYYFKEAITLSAGQIYASPIDLNIERGEVEQPHKPMLRLAIPVSNSRQERRGLLLINVFAADIFDHLARHAGLTQGHLLMIDPTGFYLRGFQKDHEWGFMFQLRDDADYRFDKRYPSVWRRMVEQGSGELDAPSGQFLFRTVRYGTESFGHRYFLLAAVLPSELKGFQAELRQLWWFVSLVVSLVLIPLSLILSYYLINCEKTR